MKKILIGLALIINVWFAPGIAMASCTCTCYLNADRSGPSTVTTQPSKEACSNGCFASNKGGNYDCVDDSAPINASTGCTEDESIKFFNSDKKIGTCNVNGFLELGLAITQFILGLVGSVALLAFIWGGFQMIMAGGDMKKIENGKSSITAAVVGLVIVFTSYLLVQFIMKSLLGVV